MSQEWKKFLYNAYIKSRCHCKHSVIEPSVRAIFCGHRFAKLKGQYLGSRCWYIYIWIWLTFTLQLSHITLYSVVKWLCHIVVTGSCYCCFAEVPIGFVSWTLQLWFKTELSSRPGNRIMANTSLAKSLILIINKDYCNKDIFNYGFVYCASGM